MILDSGELRTLWSPDWHFTVEAVAALGLIAAVVFETRFLLRLLVRKAHLEQQVSLTATALHDVIKDHFRIWTLTASEADVAWFAVKDFGFAQIADF